MKLSHRIPLFGWVFAAIFLLFCTLFTSLMVRDHWRVPIYPPDNPGYYPPLLLMLLLGVFWLFALGLAGYVLRFPCVRIEVRPDRSLSIDQRYLWRRETLLLLSEQIVSVCLVESRDAEGDPYYAVQLQPLSGPAVVISEGSDKAGCEAIRRQCAAALGKP